MTRRILAVALWAFFGWYLGALAAATTGLPSDWAPLAGLLMAVVALVDWRHGRFVRSAHQSGTRGAVAARQEGRL